MAEKVLSEHAEQVNFVNWVKYNYPEVKICAIPNGAHLSGNSVSRAKQMNKLKSEGFSKGFPDLFFPSLKLFIEMKKKKGGVVSKEQEEWLNHLSGCGYTAKVCRGASSAKEAFKLALELVGAVNK